MEVNEDAEDTEKGERKQRKAVEISQAEQIVFMFPTEDAR
jgi:hypothetical protein